MSRWSKTLVAGIVSLYGALSMAAPQDTVVVYFTSVHNRAGSDAAAVGYTQRLATELARQTHSELREIKVAQPYPADYNDTLDLAQAEFETRVKPALAPEGNPDVGPYQEIYLGFPCWWESYPRAIATWLDSQNLVDKELYVFMTHSGSRFGGALEELKQNLVRTEVHKVMAVNERDLAPMSASELTELVAAALAEIK